MIYPLFRAGVGADPEATEAEGVRMHGGRKSTGEWRLIELAILD
jgi:hypothetical protein